MPTRRSFLKLTGATTVAWYVATQTGWMEQAVAAIPGGTLDPNTVTKYVTPMLIPPVMPRAATITMPGGKPGDYYEISMRQFQEQILPAGLPVTTVWGYGAVTKSATSRGLVQFWHAPSLTIESTWKRPVRIKWINELVDANGHYRPHLLPVDQTLHWANPPGGTAGRDSRPTFTSTPGAYTGPVPIVTHLHGAAGVGDESDGYAEAWYLPAANNIPDGYASQGTWYNFFAGKATSKFGVAWGPGFATFQYPNDQRESTLWYHDHTLGMTRLNVYAGPAGFFLVRGGPEGDKAVLDRRTNTTAVLPSPAPNENDMFPPNKTYFEIPIAVQDRAFNTNGSLFYPDSRVFFDGYAGPYIPFTDVSPIWNPEFFGNMIMVNGNTWPFQTVQQRRYRLRFLNGCQSRFLILDFSSITNIQVWQIGNEGGFLAAPVNLTTTNGNRLLLGLAERADLIVDFTNVPTGDYVLANIGPDEPFGGGEPPGDFDAADPASTGQVLQFPGRAGGGGRPDHPAPVPGPADHDPPHRWYPPAAGPDGASVGVHRRAGRGTAGHHRRHRNRYRQSVGRRDHREPRGRGYRGVGVLQRHRRRPPDAHP
jgi:spore coat protein A, manganese oxidase